MKDDFKVALSVVGLIALIFLCMSVGIHLSERMSNAGITKCIESGQQAIQCKEAFK
jgi:hypothetical protein